jgi:hypothetical protein
MYAMDILTKSEGSSRRTSVFNGYANTWQKNRGLSDESIQDLKDAIKKERELKTS